MSIFFKAFSWLAAFAGLSTAVPDVVKHDMSSYDDTDHSGIWVDELESVSDEEEEL